MRDSSSGWANTAARRCLLPLPLFKRAATSTGTGDLYAWLLRWCWEGAAAPTATDDVHNLDRLACASVLLGSGHDHGLPSAVLRALSGLALFGSDGLAVAAVTSTIWTGRQPQVAGNDAQPQAGSSWRWSASWYRSSKSVLKAPSSASFSSHSSILRRSNSATCWRNGRQSPSSATPSRPRISSKDRPSRFARRMNCSLPTSVWL